MVDFEERIAQVIKQRDLIPHGQRILVAVSGGLDSMALLHVLHQLARLNHWELRVAHLNHQLRGNSSRADERLVRRAAEALKLDLTVGSVDVRSISRQHKLSLEMAARKARHDFLANTAVRFRIRTVVLAHHADDRVEMFFLRLFRGSGGDGLSGIRWRNASPANPRVELVRPLLQENRHTLSVYASEKGIRFREDASNSCLDFDRNRIRHELLPLLRSKYQPAIHVTALRVAEVIGAEADFVAQAAAEWLEGVRNSNVNLKGHPGVPFNKLHVAVQRRCLLIQLTEMGILSDFQLVETLRNHPGRAVMLPAKASLASSAVADSSAPKSFSGTDSIIRTESGLVLRSQSSSPEFKVNSLSFDLAKPAGTQTFGSLNLRWSIQKKTGASIPKMLTNSEMFDCDKIGDTVILRHWLPGDRFQPIGMHQPVKLQDFFTNQKVPRDRRRNLVLAANGQGELFWVQGMRISERFKLTKNTIRRLLWVWEEL